MTSSEIRQAFLDFFEGKTHQIVSSAPMVVKDDPTLMFTNAGMNQFKDVFLGNVPVKFPRIADTQKCLRVSGKHNDLDEVGHDTYHHTMFEMLGNWSFGDYFKKEAIAWAWELMTEVYGIDKDRLYVTVFEGDAGDKLEADKEALNFWKAILPAGQILYGSKKDNFWEMGDTGPCGPCSEIHIDIRPDAEREKLPGDQLVNMDHPLVIEIWNLVFIEYNRLKGGKLQALDNKHIDTGMGFERLAMVLQGVQSNYDTDIFKPLINKVAELANITYGKSDETDIAMRVIADHIRAVAFAIADGQLPSNTGAGYVIRRILRRAVRYGYTFLSFEEAFMYQLLPLLVEQMSNTFPELKTQQELISQVVKEEELAFLRTLSQGIRKFDQYIAKNPSKEIEGAVAFELFDTFGFPIDLTQLMAREKGYTVDMMGYEKGLAMQRERSRKAATVDAGDWIELLDGQTESEFVGYESLEVEARVVKYRKVTKQKKTIYEVVLDKTPFYAESGGQVGDQGILQSDEETLKIVDTKKENNLIVHSLPEAIKQPEKTFLAKVDAQKRLQTANNHSATHLMHAALRKVLGSHVEQKGSMVNADRFRFDFSHFAKMTDDEILEVERIVNARIRENIPAGIEEEVPIDQAMDKGAMALFGEKYGDAVRVVSFDPEFSIELCGGTHVNATGQIGYFKIVSEGGIAAGIRRLEAVTGAAAENFLNTKLATLQEVHGFFKNQKDVVAAVSHIVDQNSKLQKEVDQMQKQQAEQMTKAFLSEAEVIQGVNFIGKQISQNMGQAKLLAQKLRSLSDHMFIVLALVQDAKVNLIVSLSDDMVEEGYHAAQIIKEITFYIRGGGGGQPHLATAGGKDASGIEKAINAAKEQIK